MFFYFLFFNSEILCVFPYYALTADFCQNLELEGFLLTGTAASGR